MRLAASIVISAAFLPCGVHAGTIYKTVDANGRTAYSDKPPISGPVKLLHMPGYQPVLYVPTTTANVPAAPAGAGKAVTSKRERQATGSFVPVGDAFRPSESGHIYLFVMPGAQPYRDIIQRAAGEWGAACRMTFEYIDQPEPKAANWNEVIVVDYGPGADAGASATAFRKTTRDGKAVNYTKIIVSQTFGKGDIRFVVLHELGHAIGLPHATDRAAIMSADDGDRSYYIQSGEEPMLTSTDINGCSKLVHSKSEPILDRATIRERS
jgi:matrixin/uncharacterized protein DUF4124